jgi:nuclear transport factor 2 (NTF2) superfamily protein
VSVSKAYTIDSEWRNRTQFIHGREKIVRFLTWKWAKERNYRLKKELWGFRANRMAVRFMNEYQDENDQWYRAYGNELWEFDENGLMQKLLASVNDMNIEGSDRKLM